jgi:hypothetical protein
MHDMEDVEGHNTSEQPRILVNPFDLQAQNDLYLPVDIFKVFVDHECYEIENENKKPYPMELIKCVTRQMWKEFSKEFQYFYGRPPASWFDIGPIMFGYTHRFISYFYKCLRYYTDHPSAKLGIDILSAYNVVFGKRKRMWDDEDLDELEVFMKTLRTTISDE